MSSTEADLERVIDALCSLVLPASGAETDAELCARVEQIERLGRRADALRVQVAGEVADRSLRDLGKESLARRHGLPSAGMLLEKLARITGADAARRIRLARDTAPRVSLIGEQLPATFDVVASALHSGDLGIDSALTIVRNLTAASRRASNEQLDAGERWLVGEAMTLSADLVGVQARAWRDALDPDGAEPREAELRAQRRFVMGRERADGRTPFWGDADPISAAQMRTWFGVRTAPDIQPRFLDLDDPAFDQASDDSLVDPRTREQRSFDVLMGLLQAGVRAEASTSTPLHSAANVMVVVQATALQRQTGTAWLSDVTEPISAVSAGVMACEAGIQKVYLGPNGQPLALGRRERYFSSAQRKALAVRDGGCAWPQCTAPPSWTHAHHILPWSEDGPTDVENGVLLCAFHHHLLHEGEFELKMVDGIPYLRPPMRIDLAMRWVRMGRHRVPVAA